MKKITIDDKTDAIINVEEVKSVHEKVAQNRKRIKIILIAIVVIKIATVIVYFVK